MFYRSTLWLTYLATRVNLSCVITKPYIVQTVQALSAQIQRNDFFPVFIFSLFSNFLQADSDSVAHIFPTKMRATENENSIQN